MGEKRYDVAVIGLQCIDMVMTPVPPDALLRDTTAVGPIMRAAEAGALGGVEATKNMLPRLGRSKNIRESAIGWPDPGAISVSVLFGGMAQELSK